MHRCLLLLWKHNKGRMPHLVVLLILTWLQAQKSLPLQVKSLDIHAVLWAPDLQDVHDVVVQGQGNVSCVTVV